MLLLWRNQAAYLHQQNVWKILWKSDILGNDIGQWPASLLKLSLFILLVQINSAVRPKM